MTSWPDFLQKSVNVHALTFVEVVSVVVVHFDAFCVLMFLDLIHAK